MSYGAIRSVLGKSSGSLWMVRAISVFEGAGSTLFDGPVIEVHEGRAGASLGRSRREGRGVVSPAQGPFAPSGGRARRGFPGGVSAVTLY